MGKPDAYSPHGLSPAPEALADADPHALLRSAIALLPNKPEGAECVVWDDGSAFIMAGAASVAVIPPNARYGECWARLSADPRTPSPLMRYALAVAALMEPGEAPRFDPADALETCRG